MCDKRRVEVRYTVVVVFAPPQETVGGLPGNLDQAPTNPQQPRNMFRVLSFSVPLLRAVKKSAAVEVTIIVIRTLPAAASH